MGLVGRDVLPVILESANIRYNQTTDFIEVLNPQSNEWEQWQKSGVVFEGTNIIVTTKNLNGKTVTCSINNETYTSVFVGGSALFTVYSGGTATVTCEGVTQTVLVSEGTTSTVEVSRPYSTLTLNTTNLNGKTVTVRIDGMTYTGTFTNNSCTFTVYEIGTATITCDTVTQTQTIESGKTYTVEIIKPFAKLNFTTSDLNGKTITVTINGRTYNATFSGYVASITVYDFGTATITCDYASTTQTVESGGTYSVTLNRPSCLIELNSTTLQGEAVTVTVGGNTYTGTFSSSGNCNITVYDVFGTATITSTNASTTQTVENGKTYSVTLNRPYATINLTTENLQNQTITFTVNGVSNQVAFGSDGTVTLKVYVFGDYTFNCSETTVTQTVESGGTYTVDITEVVRVDYVIDGITTNGASFPKSGSLTYTDYTGYIQFLNTTSASSTDFSIVQIPKNTELIGKTIHIIAGIYNVTSVYYRYGLSGQNLYATMAKTASTGTVGSYNAYDFSINLDESYFTQGYDESHYIGVKLGNGGRLNIKDIYVE